MVDTTAIEKKSLEAHVELCAERYSQLELRLDNDQLISWGLGAMGSMAAVIGWLLVTYVFK